MDSDEDTAGLRGFLSEYLFDWLKGDEIDNLFLRAYDEFESSEAPRSHESVAQPEDRATSSAQLVPRPQPSSTPTSAQAVSRPFAVPKSDQEILDARVSGIPKKMQEDTQYCMRLWKEWCKYRQQNFGNCIPGLTELPPRDLQHWLTRFILEVRKKDGSEFAPDTLHHICCGIMRYLRWNGQPAIDFFTDATFAEFRASLDAEMKRLQGAGVGTKKKQVEPLTEEEEDIL